MLHLVKKLERTFFIANCIIGVSSACTAFNAASPTIGFTTIQAVSNTVPIAMILPGKKEIVTCTEYWFGCCARLLFISSRRSSAICKLSFSRASTISFSDAGAFFAVGSAILCWLKGFATAKVCELVGGFTLAGGLDTSICALKSKCNGGCLSCTIKPTFLLKNATYF